MIMDIHFTTCHHSTVKCRPRSNDYGLPNFNITPWTSEEKLEIAKISYQSLIEFCGQNVTVIDDGSDNNEAREWLASLPSVKFYEHRGSSAGINDYIGELNKSTIDVFAHFEDDMIYFNPENLDWKSICYKFLQDNPDIATVTLKSLLPSKNIVDVAYHGAWGPIGWRDSINGSPPAILFNSLANANHISLKENYLKFFPLVGSSGACEHDMCMKLKNIRMLNAEIQIPVYAFHSHCLNRPLPENVRSEDLNLSGYGIEYGIKDMYEHIKNKRKITYSYFESMDKEIYK